MTQSASARPTPLEERLADLIRLKGPITIADYMADALGHPNYGYYMTRSPFGAEGDFTTAPEISQIFGELIGMWLLDAWRAMGSPSLFNLVELGPGRGVLMEDIMRAVRIRPEFTKAACLWLFETSGRLRLEQQKRLKSCGVKPLWADDLDDIPPAPSLIVANEFFDCLPIRQFERVTSGWRERLVDVDENGALTITLGATPPPVEFRLPEIAESDEGDVFEIGFAARDFMGDLASRIVAEGGAALIVDYGHVASGFGDTLQAVRGHEYATVLASPGEVDVTAHVDFAALTDVAIDAGAAVHGPTGQGRFLERLGLGMRTELLCKGKSDADARAVRIGAHRLSAPDQMGETFKVLCVGAPDLPSPPGFFDL